MGSDIYGDLTITSPTIISESEIKRLKCRKEKPCRRGEIHGLSESQGFSNNNNSNNCNNDNNNSNRNNNNNNVIM